MFSNAQGKMDLSLVDLKLELLIISQFTLYADMKLHLINDGPVTFILDH